LILSQAPPVIWQRQLLSLLNERNKKNSPTAFGLPHSLKERKAD
jgi:hypothetical protein